MVTDALVDAVLAAFEALVTLLPVWDWPVRVVVGTVGFVGQANRVVPIATAAAMFGLFVGLKALLSGFDFAVWCYHQFWGAS